MVLPTAKVDTGTKRDCKRWVFVIMHTREEGMTGLSLWKQELQTQEVAPELQLVREILDNPMGLSAEPTTLREWKEMGLSLAQKRHRTYWQLGDWWAARERFSDYKRLKAVAQEVLERLELSYKTLQNIASVCRAYPMGERVEGLSWKAHQYALGLPPEARRAFLVRALKERWTVRRIAEEVRKARGEAVPEKRSTLASMLRVVRGSYEEGFCHPSFRSSGVFFRNGRILLREPSAWLSPEEARALAASLLVAAKVLEGD